jgi:hypothetical protein
VTRDGKALFDKTASRLDFVDVKHARVIWDALKVVRQIVKPTEVHDGWFLQSSQDPKPEAVQLNGGAALKLAPGALPGREAEWLMRQDVIASNNRSSAQAFVGTKTDESYFVDFGFKFTAGLEAGLPIRIGTGAYVFNATVEKAGVNLLKELKDRPALQTLPIGDFDTAFPDLAERTKQLSEVKLENLEKVSKRGEHAVGRQDRCYVLEVSAG